VSWLRKKADAAIENAVASAKARGSRGSVLRVRPSGAFGREVVGESNYVAAIRSAVKGREGEHMVAATLQREPSNKYDPNAIAVLVGGKRVGYVPREQTAELQHFLQCAERVSMAVEVTARVWFSKRDGGIGSVSFDLDDPAAAWPANALPEGTRHALWPRGRKLKVSLRDDAEPVVADWLKLAVVPRRAIAYLLLEEDVVKPDRLQVALNGTVLGSLSPSSSKGMMTAVVSARGQGRQIFVLGEVVGNSVAASVSVLATAPEQLTETELDELLGRAGSPWAPPTVG